MSGTEKGVVDTAPDVDREITEYMGQITAPVLQIEKRGGFVDPYVTTPNPHAEVKEA